MNPRANEQKGAVLTIDTGILHQSPVKEREESRLLVSVDIKS